MIDPHSVLFYDGYRSLPRKARIELIEDSIYLFDEDGPNTDNGIVFPIKNCVSSFLEKKLFVYLGKGSSPYFVMDQTNPYYEELSEQLSNQVSRGWYGELMQQKWITLGLVLIIITSVFYFILTGLLPAAAVRLISVSQESSLGEKVYQSIIADSKIDSSSTILAQQLADQLKLSDKYKIKVTVVKEAEINAYALPGGHIVINSGIFKIMESPNELAALLGHEATHIQRRHSLKGLLSKMGISLFQSIAFSGMGGVGDLILKNASTLRQLSYSRDLEREADTDGMELLFENNINPSGMKELLIHLQASIKTSIPSLSFISTHPLTQERIENAENLLLKFKYSTTEQHVELAKIWGLLKQGTEQKTGISLEIQDPKTNSEYLDFDAVRINQKLPLLCLKNDLIDLLGKPDSLITPNMDDICVSFFDKDLKLLYFGKSQFENAGDSAIISSLHFDNTSKIKLNIGSLILDNSFTLTKVISLFPISVQSKYEATIENGVRVTIVHLEGSKKASDFFWTLFFYEERLIRIDYGMTC